MLKNFSPQNKSFAVLFGIAVVGTYLTVMLGNSLASVSLTDLQPGGYVVTYYHPGTSKSGNKAAMIPTAQAAPSNAPAVNTVSTFGWKTYSDPAHRFSFEYAPAWQVKPAKADNSGFYKLAIDPGKKYYNINIYISQSGYYASMDTLPNTPDSIGGQPAINVSDLLYGVKAGGFYYTFDNGLSTELKDNFNALIKSVKFQ